MSKIDWRQFERLVAAIHHSESQGAEVKWNDNIDGRQFDVTVRFKFGLHNYLTVIECKNYSSKVSIDKLDALSTKYKDVKADKAVMVSSNGYQSGCIEVAKRHGIRLLTLNENINLNIQDLTKEIIPALNVYKVRFVEKKESNEYELEDVGGRLSYLMENIKLIINGVETTPKDIINHWQIAQPGPFTNQENDIEIQFPNPVTAQIPYEDSILVKALRFKYAIVERIVPNRPLMDNHILETLATEYELRDIDGKIASSKRLFDLELGYDTNLEKGKFYRNGSLKSYYYCEAIDGGLVSWILVESYQHGKLLRARLKQDVKYSVYYIEVTDKRVINRLQKLLEEYNGLNANNANSADAKSRAAD